MVDEKIRAKVTEWREPCAWQARGEPTRTKARAKEKNGNGAQRPGATPPELHKTLIF